MKRKISISILTFVSVIMFVFVINSCKKSALETTPSSAQTIQNSNTPALDAKSLIPDTKALASDSREHNKAKPHFNLEVILRSTDGNNGGEDDNGDSFGHVKFRQDEDAAKIITLDVWVRDLLPNHSYLLQRAVDTNLDGNCTSTSWLTLGKGLTPQSILTDDKGTGREDLWRDVTAIPSGSTFDIHFQIVDEVSLAVVLTSDCYQYTVR